MFTNGPITRGVNCKKKLPIDERIYLFCRGRINDGITSGLTAKGYVNEYDAKPIKTGYNEIPAPTAAQRDGYLYLPINYSDLRLLGTANPIEITKRYLVIEAKKGNSLALNDKVQVKLSNSKEIGDDGGLYSFDLNNDFTKHVIDLYADGITGRKYIAVLTGLLYSNATATYIKRIYLTDKNEESGLIVAYNAGQTDKYTWQGWTGPDGLWEAATIESNYIDLTGDQSHFVGARTSKKVNFSGKNFVGIEYECTRADATASNNTLYISFDTSNNEEVAGGYFDIPNTGTGIVRMRLNGTAPSGSGIMTNACIPSSGEEKMAIWITKYADVKIKKIWLE